MAIALHWAIAFLIIGMLVVGKYMTNLDENDSSRFVLTQWHKSFGITVLLLSILRLIWRLTHKPPLPDHKSAAWELFAAEATHYLFYLLIIGIPLTGWIMVSASPLNIPTILFQFIPWAHLPYLDTLQNKSDIADLFHSIHEISSNLLILLLLLHIGAAIRHQFILHDNVMVRMSPLLSSGKLTPGFGKFFIAAIVVASTIFVTGELLSPSKYSQSAKYSQSSVLAAGQSEVSFTVPLMGMDLKGSFRDTSVELILEQNSLANSSLNAQVSTEFTDTTDVQIASSLPGQDWFDSKYFPMATFTSDTISTTGNDGEFIVEGILQIKDFSQTVNFPLSISTVEDKQRATGGFTINRLDYKIGSSEQPDDSTVGLNVLIEFAFDLN